jgi:epothilone polyketide synthase D
MYNIDELEIKAGNIIKQELTKRSIDLLPISAPSIDQAQQVARDIYERFKEIEINTEYKSLIESSWRSARLPNRWVLAGFDTNDMRRSIEDFIFEGRCVAAGVRHTNQRKVTFIFSGMGPQWSRMGRELASSFPEFKSYIGEIDNYFKKYYGKSVWDELVEHEGAEQLPTALAQTGNFLIQAALFSVLIDQGITPDSIIGHSAGEVASAYAAGVYTLEEAVRVAVTRGKLQAKLAGRGSMLAVGMSRNEAVNLIAGKNGVSIAAINDDNGVTLSGESKTINDLDNYLKQNSIFSKLLRVEVPYHSPVMDEITQEITEGLDFLRPAKSKCTLYSTVTGTIADGSEWTGNYWACNIRQPVLFSDALKESLENGSNCFVEISPHPVLSQSIDSIAAEYSSISIHHMMSRKENELQTVLSRLGELAIDGVGRPKKSVSAPLLRTPSSPQVLWDEDESLEKERKGEFVVQGLRLLGKLKNEISNNYEIEISTTIMPWISGHDVAELGVVVPATMWAEIIALAATEGREESITLAELTILKALPVSETLILIRTKLEAGKVKCFSRPVGKLDSWTLHAVATVNNDEVQTTKEYKTKDNHKTCQGMKVSTDRLYQSFQIKGLNYRDHFQNLDEVIIGTENDAWAVINGVEDFTVGNHSPWILDAGLQLLIVAAKDWSESMYLPFKIGRVTLYHSLKKHENYKAYAKITMKTVGEIIGSVQFYNNSGKLLAEMENIICIRNHSDDIERQNYIDRNSYVLCNRSPREVLNSTDDTLETEEFVSSSTENISPSDDNETGELQYKELWIDATNKIRSTGVVPFERPFIGLKTIKNDETLNLLWLVSDSNITNDIMNTIEIIQAVGNLDNRSLVLTLIAKKEQHWISGLRRSASNSYGLLVRVVFVDVNTTVEMLESAISYTKEHEITFENNTPFFKRLEKITSSQLLQTTYDLPNTDKEINENTLSFDVVRGKFSQMVCTKEKLRKPKKGEMCIKTHSTGILWKDIGKILGTIGTSVVNTLTGQHIGFGIGGEVVATGEGTEFKVGDTIFGALHRPYRQYVTLNKDEIKHMRHVPDGIDSTTAIAHALPWITTITVFDDPKPKPDEKIFIQSGAGALGSILCLYAKQLGATVITSVGTEDKIENVTKLVPGVEVIVARGAEIPKALMKAGHKGFDRIVSTLNGNARDVLLSMLNTMGKYTDVGKPRSVDENILMATLDNNRSYRVIDVDQLCARVPGWLEKKLDEIIPIIADNKNLIPVKRYPISQIGQALVHMAQGNTTGCVTISIDEKYEPEDVVNSKQVMSSEGVYIITGGYGAVGLLCAQWLSSRGAKHMVLCGRSGKLNKQSSEMISLLKATGNDIEISTTDISDRQSIENMIDKIKKSGRKISGVIHAAGSVSDGPFNEIDEERIITSYSAKLYGANHLVDILDESNQLQGLEFILFTSSISSVIGLQIQGTYASANSGLDGLAESLRKRGVNACSMQLAPIEAGGMAADESVVRYFSTIGLTAITPRRLFGVLDLAVASDVPHFVTDDIDWTRNARTETANATSSLLQHIIEESSSGEFDTDIEHLISLDHSDRTEVLTITLLGVVSDALGVESESLNAETNFSALGVDSLAIMEVQAGINEILQQDLPLARMFNQDSTIGQLASQISEYITKNTSTEEAAA